MRKGAIKQFIEISCTNIRGQNKISTLGPKMINMLSHLEANVKVLVDTHTDESFFSQSGDTLSPISKAIHRRYIYKRAIHMRSIHMIAIDR